MARQYSGTAGRTENCQIGVFLAYASPQGHALIDRELYIPRSWVEDRERSRAAGIPDDIEFATKPRLAQAMLARTLLAGVPFAWFTADEVYGQAKFLHAWLEERNVSYVLAIKCNDTLTMPAGQQRADELIAAVPARAWQRLSAGAGAHGPREYHWARVPARPALAWWTWPGSRAAAGMWRKGTSSSEPGMIGDTLPQSRRLLTAIAWRCLPTPNTSWPGQTGGANANTKPGSATTGGAAMPLPNCCCNIKCQTCAEVAYATWSTAASRERPCSSTADQQG